MAVLFWAFCGPALALALLSLWGERARVAYVRAKQTDAFLPPATVIVPVKGQDEGLRQNLASLAAQDYPDYELIVAARRALDIPAGVLPARVKIVLADAEDALTGEKIQNLQAGVRAARKVSEVFAFADSDGLAPRGWLRALVAPLADTATGAATGYRWYARPVLRSVWNGAVAGTFGPRPCLFAWGGATAIRKETFFAAGVAEAWKNAISDDYRLSAAVRKAGLRIVFAPGAMVRCAGGATTREFFLWARRQLLLTRFYAPGVWRLALAIHVLYCAAMAAAAAAALLGHPRALCALAGIAVPGMLRAYTTARLYGGGESGTGPNSRGLRMAGLSPICPHGARPLLNALLAPPGTWISLALFAASAFGDTVRWRGRGYVLGRGGFVKSGYNDSR